MGEATTYEKKDHLAILTLNRPEAMNAMNAAMRREMGEAFVSFRDDADAWVLIITGAGDRAFCAGMDLREMAAGLAQRAQGTQRQREEPEISLMAGNTGDMETNNRRDKWRGCGGRSGNSAGLRHQDCR